MMHCQIARDLPDGWAGTLWPDPATTPQPGPAAVVPDLHLFWRVVARVSGGKDSQAMLHQLWRTAVDQGYDLSRIVVEYDELNGKKPDEKATWPGTAEIGAHLVVKYGDRPGSLELARQHAAHYGFRFEVARQQSRPPLMVDMRTRKGSDGRTRFPDAKNRWCTSDHKRAAGRLLLTRLVKEAGGKRGNPARVLTVMGFRAQESTGRARREVFSYDAGASGKGMVRQVWLWLPIHHWTVEQVWAGIHASGVPYAWPYDAGMSRYSCAQCVLGSFADAVRSAQIWPAHTLQGKNRGTMPTTRTCMPTGVSTSRLAAGWGWARSAGSRNWTVWSSGSPSSRTWRRRACVCTASVSRPMRCR